MWRSKKFIIITVLVAVVLVGSIGGVAFAQSGRDGHHPPGPPRHGPGGAIFEGFGVDREALQAAFEQARSELGEGTLEGGRRAGMSRVLEILGISEDEWQAACSQAWESCPEMRPGLPPEGRPGGAILESFGVDQEALQAAFEQARSELGEGTLEGGRRAVMSRVLEILGISEDEWQAACSQAREARPEMRPGPPPEGRPPFDHGFGFRGPGGRPHGSGGFGEPPDTQ